MRGSAETGGSATELSAADAWRSPTVDDEGYVRLNRTIARSNLDRRPCRAPFSISALENGDDNADTVTVPDAVARGRMIWARSRRNLVWTSGLRKRGACERADGTEQNRILCRLYFVPVAHYRVMRV
jgi:hypothetical protein